MTATTTVSGATAQPQAPASPGTALANSSSQPIAQAPIHKTPTPRLIRGLRNALIVILLFFCGMTIVATVAPEVGLGSASADISLGQKLRGARATLAEADRKASVAFLAPSIASANGEWTDYQATIDQVSTMLLLAAADRPGDTARLSTVQIQISEYRRSVDAAWTLAGTGSATGNAQYVEAGSKLSQPLATLATLSQESDSRIGKGTAFAFGQWAVVAGGIALASLLLSSFLVARRTHRVINIGLTAGLLLVLAAVALASTANNVVQQSLSDASTTSLVGARINADTRTTAELAKAAEDRMLLKPTLGESDWTQLNTSVVTQLETLTDVAEQDLQKTSWTKYTDAHAVLTAATTTAKDQGRTKTLEPLVSFSDSAKNLAELDATVATSTLASAQRMQLTLGIAACVAAILALFSSVWGLTRRLSEYV